MKKVLMLLLAVLTLTVLLAGCITITPRPSQVKTQAPTTAPTVDPAEAATPTPTPSAEASPSPASASTAEVQFENQTFTISIGEIGTDADGNTTVAINALGMGNSIPIRNGKAVVSLQASIVAGGKTIGWSGASIKKDLIEFTFKTKKAPEKIIVYAYGKKADSEGSITFDAATKAVLP